MLSQNIDTTKADESSDVGNHWILRMFGNRRPLAFDAGDSNLYRYAGNKPTIDIDTTGLQDAPAPSLSRTGRLRDNERLTNGAFILFGIETPFRFLLSPLVDFNDRANYIGGIRRLGAADLPRVPAGWHSLGVTGGRNWIGRIPPQVTVGPSGCGPCVGLVIIPPPRNSLFCVFHFTAGDDPLRTIGNLARFVSRDFRGFRAVINGGENVEGSEADVARTFARVIVALRRLNIPIIGYVPGPNFGVDSNGQIYWTTPDGVNTDGY